jgi:hypothetical protein
VRLAVDHLHLNAALARPKIDPNPEITIKAALVIAHVGTEIIDLKHTVNSIAMPQSHLLIRSKQATINIAAVQEM